MHWMTSTRNRSPDEPYCFSPFLLLLTPIWSDRKTADFIFFRVIRERIDRVNLHLIVLEAMMPDTDTSASTSVN